MREWLERREEWKKNEQKLNLQFGHSIGEKSDNMVTDA